MIYIDPNLIDPHKQNHLSIDNGSDLPKLPDKAKRLSSTVHPALMFEK
ncbi:hypothetical protein HRF87_26340 [Bacillus sp. CRN 9]|nr:hypothetical protein [Bacillus sp. CRN 9]